MADPEATLIAFLQSASEGDMNRLIVELQDAAQYNHIVEVLCKKLTPANKTPQNY